MTELIRRDLDAELIVRAPSEGTDERIIEGIVVPWGEIATVRSVGMKGEPPAGKVYQETFARGAAASMKPERVTLESSEHKGKLVGRGVTADDRAEGQHMAFRVAHTPAGDELLELAREGILTKMSVVFADENPRIRPDGVYERTAVDIQRVAVLERGAYPSAQVSAVRAEPTKPIKQEIKKVADKEYVTPEDRAARIGELDEVITRKATEFPGVMPAPAKAELDELVAERGALVADAKAWDERAVLLRDIAEGEGAVKRTESGSGPTFIVRKSESDVYDMNQYGPGQVRSIDERNQKLRDNAMHSLERSSFAQTGVDQDKAKEGVQKLLDFADTREKELANRILLTGSPQYQREFTESLRTMRPTEFLSRTHERAAALAVVGTTTTGGYMVPYVFDPTFIKTGAHTNINPFRQVCRVEQIVGGNKWQGVSVGAVPAIYETEALAVTEAGPTFSNPTMTAQRASSFVSISYETLQDRPSIVNELADLIQEGKDTLEEAQFSIGVGTTVYPLGMFVKSTFTVKETITNDTFAVADLDATEAALPIRHRREAVWMLSRAVIRIIQGWETAYGKLFNSTLGYPAVGDIANNPGGNTGMSLLGYPVWETPSAPVTVTTDDTIVGILVSPKNFMVLDRVGMNVELIPNLVNGDGLPTGQRGILALWRNTARALNADAGRQININ